MLDLMMPVMDGYGVLAELAKDHGRPRCRSWCSRRGRSRKRRSGRRRRAPGVSSRSRSIQTIWRASSPTLLRSRLTDQAVRVEA